MLARLGVNQCGGRPVDRVSPVLVVVDEAQLFAPAVASEVPDEARKLSLAAMTNLMCRGRKRGLAGQDELTGNFIRVRDARTSL